MSWFGRSVEDRTDPGAGADEDAESLRQRLDSAHAALFSVRDAVIQTGHDDEILFMNPAAERLTGWGSGQLQGRRLAEALDMDYAGPEEETVRRNQSLPDGVFTVIRPRGHDERVVLVSRSEHTHGSVYIMRETPGGAAEPDRGRDTLTGLPDRGALESRLAEILDSGDRDGHQLLYLDLDQFKVINEICGHRAGDELLRRLTGQWAALLHEGEVLSRLGGDEFCMILHRASLDEAKDSAERMIAIAREMRFIWAGDTFRIGASCGLVEFTPFRDPGALLAAADTACWTAKDSGRNRLQVFDTDDEGLNSRRRQMGWVARISHALEADRLLLHHQRISPLSDRAAQGVHQEILLRMLTDEGEVVMPNEFIPAAERYNLMPQIDRWVVQAVFSGLARRLLENPGEDPGITSINLSGTSFSDARFVDSLLESFRTHGLPAGSVCFELTETAAIGNLDKAHEFIRRVHDLGCAVSLDDFGSGVSSFTYLRELDVDYLKIDGSFVQRMDRDPVNRAMVEAIHKVGTVMGIPTIAEYVDSDAVSRCLEAIGVDYAQGHHLDEPRPWPWTPRTSVDWDFGEM